jgi:hypothetical protein
MIELLLKSACGTVSFLSLAGTSDCCPFDLTSTGAAGNGAFPAVAAPFEFEILVGGIFPPGIRGLSALSSLCSSCSPPSCSTPFFVRSHNQSRSTTSIPHSIARSYFAPDRSGQMSCVVRRPKTIVCRPASSRYISPYSPHHEEGSTYLRHDKPSQPITHHHRLTH